jgi:hypothetical protein
MVAFIDSIGNEDKYISQLAVNINGWSNELSLCFSFVDSTFRPEKVTDRHIEGVHGSTRFHNESFTNQ